MDILPWETACQDDKYFESWDLGVLRLVSLQRGVRFRRVRVVENGLQWVWGYAGSNVLGIAHLKDRVF